LKDGDRLKKKEERSLNFLNAQKTSFPFPGDTFLACNEDENGKKHVPGFEPLIVESVKLVHPAGDDHEGVHESGLVPLDAQNILNVRKSENGYVTWPHAYVIVVVKVTTAEKVNGYAASDGEYHHENLVFGSLDS
jgi:hypothetical protein